MGNFRPTTRFTVIHQEQRFALITEQSKPRFTYSVLEQFDQFEWRFAVRPQLAMFYDILVNLVEQGVDTAFFCRDPQQTFHHVRSEKIFPKQAATSPFKDYLDYSLPPEILQQQFLFFLNSTYHHLFKLQQETERRDSLLRSTPPFGSLMLDVPFSDNEKVKKLGAVWTWEDGCENTYTHLIAPLGSWVVSIDRLTSVQEVEKFFPWISEREHSSLRYVFGEREKIMKYYENRLANLQADVQRALEEAKESWRHHNQ